MQNVVLGDIKTVIRSNLYSIMGALDDMGKLNGAKYFVQFVYIVLSKSSLQALVLQGRFVFKHERQSVSTAP